MLSARGLAIDWAPEQNDVSYIAFSRTKSDRWQKSKGRYYRSTTSVGSIMQILSIMQTKKPVLQILETDSNFNGNFFRDMKRSEWYAYNNNNKRGSKPRHTRLNALMNNGDGKTVWLIQTITGIILIGQEIGAGRIGRQRWHIKYLSPQNKRLHNSYMKKSWSTSQAAMRIGNSSWYFTSLLQSTFTVLTESMKHTTTYKTLQLQIIIRKISLRFIFLQWCENYICKLKIWKWHRVKFNVNQSTETVTGNPNNDSV